MDEQRLLDGSLYRTNDADFAALQQACLEKLYDYNHTRPRETARRQALLQDMFAAIGPHCYLEPPLNADWGGRYCHFGDHVYANFNLTLVDDARIDVGDRTLFGPNVVLATAGHPVLPELRDHDYQYGAPITIGRNCWLGAGAIVLSGVTIGDNSVIGAGSVVTKDVSANVVAVGNPCRVLRPIDARDRETYFKGRRIDWAQVKAELAKDE